MATLVLGAKHRKNAHNERDLDALMKMESDSISIDAQDGSVIQGKEIHRSALEA